MQKVFAAALLLSLGSRPATAMDRVRVESRIDAAVAKYGVTGRGVIVALLDRGIDWKNADFRNPDGTTRIAAVLDLTDDSGAATSGYGKGTRYTRAQIDAALSGGPAIPFRDAVGHGTTTSGIPAGNGRNLAKYRGVAPEATIISVKVTSDGAPAHDGEAAEAGFYDPARLPLAIDFVKDRARELGLPAVMLLNLGSSGGPTDGTSELARKIDATVGPGIPGLIFVTGPGDDGGMANRAGGNVGSGATETIRIQKGATGNLTFDLWYPGADRFDVTIQTPTATYGPYVSPATNADFATTSNSEFLYYQNGSSRVFTGAQNGKRQVWIRFTGPTGVYTVSLRGHDGHDGPVRRDAESLAEIRGEGELLPRPRRAGQHLGRRDGPQQHLPRRLRDSDELRRRRRNPADGHGPRQRRRNLARKQHRTDVRRAPRPRRDGSGRQPLHRLQPEVVLGDLAPQHDPGRRRALRARERRQRGCADRHGSHRPHAPGEPDTRRADREVHPPADGPRRLLHGGRPEHDLGLREGRCPRRARRGDGDDALRSDRALLRRARTTRSSRPSSR